MTRSHITQSRANFIGSFVPKQADVILLAIAVLSIFLYSIRVYNNPIIFFPQMMVIFVIIIQCFRHKLYINNTVLQILLIILLHSLVGVLFDTTNVSLVAENILRMAVLYLAFSSVLLERQEMVKIGIAIYLKICVILAISGLIALPAYVIGFWPAYDYSWFLNSWTHIIWNGHFGLPRAQSIFGEPSNAVYVMGPALYFAVGRIIGKQYDFLNIYQALIIATFLFFTNSTTLYFAALFAILLNIRLSLKSWIMIAILGIAFVMISPDLSDSLKKIEKLFQIYEEEGTTIGVSGSSYTAYVGWAIATEIWKETHSFGGGVGAFEYTFDRLLSAIGVAKGNMGNYQTGGSLLVRVIAELGLLGMALFALMLYTFIKGFWKFSGQDKSIHTAMAFSLLPFLVRMGSYEAFGLAFFITAYIINYRVASQRIKRREPMVKQFARASW